MRWFRRTPDPRTREGASTIEIDGIRYDGRAMSMPQGVGTWQAFTGRIRRAYRALTGNGEESRAITSLPWSVGDPLTPTSASQERALRMGPVWSAIRLITDTVSTLPIHPYRRQGELRLPISMPQLFRQLDESGQLVPWLARCVASLMLRGNAYGLITARDGMQFPTAIQWLDPNEVSCDDTNPWVPIWYWRGQVVPTEDFLHIPWVVVPGKVQGLSPIEAYALTVSTGLQAQEYGSNWFANGGIPPGTFKNSQRTVDQTAAEAISQRLVSAVRSRRPIVYGFDWDYNAITVPPDQAQFIETMKLSAAQIAAIYGIPPEEIGGSTGDSMTYVTDEMNQIKLARSLRPLLVRLENAFSSVLPSAQRVKLNADATARADLTARYGAYQVGLASGFLTIDEVRALEDLPPLPPGALPPPQPAVARAAVDFEAIEPQFFHRGVVIDYPDEPDEPEHDEDPATRPPFAETSEGVNE